MASPCPRSSASSPQNAPGVSTNVMTARPNFSACFIRRRAFLYPSGEGIPKLHLMFSFVVWPLRIPITVTGCPSSVAIPPMIAASSLTPLSPWNSIKSSKIVSIYSAADGRSLLLAILTLSQAVKFFCFFCFFFFPKVSIALATVSLGNSLYCSLMLCIFNIKDNTSFMDPRSAIPSRKPWSRRNSGRWKPSGSF